MSYQETVEWLFRRLPAFQQKGIVAYKKDLSNIIQLCGFLGNPQQKFKSIHIAGTNGKGSTAHMLASVFQENGYKTGLHTSPHLKDFRERIRIDGQVVPKKFVINFVEKIQPILSDINASFFEVSVAMAFDYFAIEKVDIAIVETGLGGTLDSTNIINPELSLITNIGKDHTHILGNSLAEIAENKAGIIKSNTPVVIGKYLDETLPVFQQKAAEMNAKIYFAQQTKNSIWKTDLKGNYQQKNLKTVQVAIHVLNDLGWNLSDEKAQLGLQKVVANTRLRGRWEVLQEKPLIVADTAHNSHGIAQIIPQIKATPHQKLHLVLGFVKDKSVLEILEFFPKDAVYYFTQPNVERKFSIDDLKKIIPENLNASFYSTVNKAMSAARENAHPEDCIYIGGSTFVVAEVV